MEPKPDEPATPQDLDLRELPFGVRAELRGVGQKTAEIVGAHLLMAGKLIDTDPKLAYSHAEAARRRAARLPITREATAETAYAAGYYDVALKEFRALRRVGGGSDEYLPAMADCERFLGRTQQALALIKEGKGRHPDVPLRVELTLVEAAIRRSRGQTEEALRLLRKEIELIGNRGSKLARARLRYGFADHLESSGALAQAEQWFTAVVSLDTEATTDAFERVAALQGMTITFDESEDEEDIEPDSPVAAETDTEDAPSNE
ncbi:MAG: tetratricopeptide repeat protein [Propionibacteriaceae bacterium]|nr:tetratricopeptide repeat protein [Propionibacteriaceae bacterium]